MKIETYEFENAHVGWGERFTRVQELAKRELVWVYQHDVSAEGDSSPLRVCMTCGGVRQNTSQANTRTWPKGVSRTFVSSCPHDGYFNIPRVNGIDSLGEWFIVTFERCKLCNTLISERKGRSCPKCDRALGCNYDGIGYASETVEKILHVERPPMSQEEATADKSVSDYPQCFKSGMRKDGETYVVECKNDGDQGANIDIALRKCKKLFWFPIGQKDGKILILGARPGYQAKPIVVDCGWGWYKVSASDPSLIEAYLNTSGW